jgi:tight adherence protein B
VLIGAVATALAADPVAVSVTDVKAGAGTVTGVLTLTSKTPFAVDPDTLTATIDGTARVISIQQSAPVQRTAMLVIDTSGSMDDAGIATVQSATAQYLRVAPTDVKVGVVSFATTAGVDLAPTLDRAAVQEIVDGLRSGGDTSLYAAVDSALGALGGTGDRSIVLLSDGEDTISDNQAADRARVTAALEQADIRVDVVQFRTDDPDAVVALQGFAAANGGTVVAADDTAAVEAAFTASATALNSQVPFEIDVSGLAAGPHTLELTGTAGGTPFTITRPVELVPAARPAPSAIATSDASAADALATVPTASQRSWFPIVAAVLGGLGVFLLAAVMLAPSLQTRKEKRIGSIESYVPGPRAKARAERNATPTPLSQRLTALGERAMSGRKSAGWLTSNIERADLPFRVGDWAVLNVCAVVVGAAMGALVIRSWIGLLLGGLLGLVLPAMVLRGLAMRRANRFEQILPDVLMLVATSLSSGFGLPQALDAVAQDAAEPAAKEFSRALAETRIGSDVADALDRVAERMGSQSLRWTVMAIRIQRGVGGNLADTLRTTARTLRDREALRRQVLTLSAEGRLSMYILIALPIALFGYMTFVNFEYLSLLWTTTLGVLMLLVAFFLLIVGIFWMRRTVRIEV